MTFQRSTIIYQDNFIKIDFKQILYLNNNKNIAWTLDYFSITFKIQHLIIFYLFKKYINTFFSNFWTFIFHKIL